MAQKFPLHNKEVKRYITNFFSFVLFSLLNFFTVSPASILGFGDAVSQLLFLGFSSLPRSLSHALLKEEVCLFFFRGVALFSLLSVPY